MKTVVRPETEMKDSGIEWIGNIPRNWKLRKINSLFETIGSGTTPNSNIEGYYQGIVNWLQSGDINGTIVKSTKKHISSEIVSNTSALTVYKSPFIAIAMYGASIGNISIVDIDACTNQACCVLVKSIEDIYMQFAFWELMVAKEELVLSSRGGGQPNISQNIIKQLRIPVPHILEQQAIADYLDKTCSKIDEIIAEAKASIDEYKELKQALIFETVTKGLSSSNNTCFNSDIEWADGVCSSWDISQIRYLYELRKEINDKPLEEVNLISLYTDKGVLQHSDIEKTSGNKAVTAEGYKIVYPDDIVVNIILCWMGAMGRSDYYGVTSPAYDIYKPIDETKVSSRYYHYLFRTDRFAKKCYTVGRGIMMMRWRTYSSEFRSIKVPIPPKTEQEEIADFLDKRTAEIDSLITEKESLIADLEAYKKSLIYEVVTGKRRVV